MKVLVTGSQGSIGNPLSNSLIQKNHEVYGLDKAHHKNEHAFTMGYAPPGEYFKCDVSEYRQIQQILEFVDPDMVYHTAAEFGRWNGEDFYESLWKSNAIGTKHLLKLQETMKFKMVFFSSSEVYGDYEEVMREDVLDKFAIQQMNDYALSKWVNEIQIRNSKKVKNCAIIRLFNVYGPGERYSPYRSVLCRMIYSCIHNLPFQVFTGHKRSHAYIQDIVDALVNFADPNIYDYNNFHDTINLGSNDQHTIEDLCALVKEVVGNDWQPEFKDTESNTTKHKIVDSTKAIQRLRFSAGTSLRDGIKNTAEWLKCN